MSFISNLIDSIVGDDSHVIHWNEVELHVKGKTGGTTQINEIVRFKDGSWANLNTGEVCNCGSGSMTLIGLKAIMVSPSKQSIEEKPITISKEFPAAESLICKDLHATVNIEPWFGKGIAIQITGPQECVDLVQLSNNNGKLMITGGETAGQHASKSSSYIKSSGNISTTNISGRGSDSLNIVIKIPRGMPLTLDDVQGKTTVGDCEGGVVIINNTLHNMKLGKIANAKITNSSLGKITIAQITGDLTVIVSGSGNVIIDSAKGSRATARVLSLGKLEINNCDFEYLDYEGKGGGNFSFKGTVSKADIKNMSMGKVDLGTVMNYLKVDSSGNGNVIVDTVSTGEMNIKQSSMGKVYIKQGKTEKLNVKVSGMGNFVFEGVAENAQELNTASMGNIKIDRVNKVGTISQTGMGRVKIG